MSDFLKAQGMSEEDYEEDCQQYAESKVEQNLIVQGIMDAEGLSLDDDDIQTLKRTSCYQNMAMRVLISWLHIMVNRK